MATKRTRSSKYPAQEFHFPRGGGVEISQSLMELESGLSPDGNEKGRKRKKESKRSFKKQARIEQGMEEISRVETLAKQASKRIVSNGEIIWGMVMEIGRLYLNVSLPNGLEGRVHASEASDYLADLFSAMDASDNTHSRKHYPRDAPSLSSLFFIGQLVRCVVVDDWEPRKPAINPAPLAPVALSLVLRKVHSNLSASSLREGMLIAGCITTIEDHGYNVSLGLDDNGDQILSGFLPRNRDKLDSDVLMPCGMIVEFCIKKISDHRPIILSCVPEEIVRICREPSHVCPFDEVLPGMLVNATIQEISPDGLSVSFLDHIGHVDILHLREDILPTEWQKEYSVQQTLPARVIQVNPKTQDVSLSLKAHLIEFTMPAMPPIVGQIVDKARIVRVDDGMGLLLDIPFEMMRTPGYVDKAMADDALTKQMESDPSGLRGSNLRVKVTGFHLMDGLLVACSREELMNSCLSYEDLVLGALVEGTVAEVEDGRASIVKLSEGLRGFVPGHLRGRPDRKGVLKIGSKIQCRVGNLKPAYRKVTLTTQERLVNAKHPTVSDWGDLTVGMRTTGWISGKTFARGLGVRFYGDLKGYMPYDLLGVASPKEALQKYLVGDILRVYVTGFSATKRWISLSLRKPSKKEMEPRVSRNNAEPSVDLASCSGGSLWPGDLVQARFSKPLASPEGQSSIVVSIHSKARNVDGEALLPVAHLSDSFTGAEIIYQSLHEGLALGTLMVLQVEPYLLVTRKPSLLRKAESLPSKIEDIRESMMLSGYISQVGRSHVNVAFLGGLEGSVRKFQLPFPDVLASSQFCLGQSVLAQVIRVSRPTFTMTMNRSKTGSTDAVYLHNLFCDIAFAQKAVSKHKPNSDSKTKWRRDLCVGKVIRVLIKEIADGRWLCCPKKHPDVQGMIDKSQCPNSKPSVGDEMDALVLDIGPEFDLKLSAKPELLTKGSKSSVKPLATGLKLRGIVESVTDDYAIASVPKRNHEIVFLAAADYNIQGTQVFAVGQKIEGVVSVLPCKSTGMRTLMYVPLTLQSIGRKVDSVPVNAPLDLNRADAKYNMIDVACDDDVKADRFQKTIANGGLNENPSEKGEQSGRRNEKSAGIAGIPYALAEGQVDSEELVEASGESVAADGAESDAEECSEGLDDGLVAGTQDDGWGELVLNDADEDKSPVERKRKMATSVDSAKSKKVKTWEEKEDLVREEEKRQSLDQKNIETDTDFEKLVVEEPNSSYIWIQYMSFLLSLGEVGKARSIAERALDTIGFREEQEKLNVWVAYLNLENQFGNPPEEAVGKLFIRAIAYNDPKKLHLALLGILEGSERSEMINELVKTMCRKFSSSTKVWLRVIEIELTRGEHGRSRNLLARALATLPKRKHIKFIVKAALMEFRMGNLERGREMFEGLITNYPKRLDLWRLYIDQEVRMNDVDRTKSLFERATHLQLPPKKIKHLFKTYLKYVKDRGDNAGVAHVKKSAMEYVERLVRG